MKKLILVAAVASLTTGCVQRVADLSLASTKNVNMNSTQFVNAGRVTAEDKTPIILFPIGIPSVETATDKAIENHPCGVALENVVVDFGHASFIIGAQWYAVSGDLIIDESKNGCKSTTKTFADSERLKRLEQSSKYAKK